MPAETMTSEIRNDSAHGTDSLYDKLLFGLFLLLAFFAPVSISGAETAGAVVVLLWIGNALRGRVKLLWPLFTLPLAIFLVLSALAVIFSTNPARSLFNARGLLVFILVPIVPALVNSLRKAVAVLISLSAGAISTACWGLFQVALGAGGGEDGRRLTGFLGHYMTAGAALMLVVIALLAVILLAPERRMKIAAGAAALLPLIALGLTQSRNAYVGLAVGCLVVLFLWRPGVVALLPFALSLAVLLSPPMVRERIFSIANFEDASIRNRFEMLDRGTAMIADYPIFGAGLQQVQALYPRYKKSPSSPDVPHLHNNLLQIAAERGIPAAVVWLWFIAVIFFSTAGMARASGIEPWLRITVTAACGSVAALFSAGMFEFNFGDTEVIILFLLIIAIPFGIAPRLLLKPSDHEN
jgi:O-antigen ligase